MLPVLITLLVVGLALAVVYAVGSRPSAKKARDRNRSRAARGLKAERPTSRKPAFREAPTWLRRLPLILVIAAVACLVVAVTQFRVAKQKATPVVALVLDSSQSMDAVDVSPSRLVAAQNAAQVFLGQLPDGFEVALVSFADTSTVLVTPTTNRQQVATVLGKLPRGKGTVIGDGLAATLDTIQARWSATGPSPAAIVLLSDGRDTGSEVSPQAAAERAAQLGVPVYTVILGSQDGNGKGANAALLQQMAATTGATATTAGSAGELSNVYGALGSQLSSELKIGSSAQLFVILAIALAMAAAVILLLVSLMKTG